MQIGIHDLDDDDFGMGFEPTNQEPQNQEPPQNLEPPGGPTNDDLNLDDFLSDFLKTRGIDDITKIKFEEDDGSIVERNWKDLTREEKFNIFNTPLEEPSHIEDNNELTEDEINFINLLRELGVTPQEYIQSITPGEEEPRYKIDDLSDDEVYLLDLESRVGELSDEDAAQALTNAKQNEDFYKKQVEGIRKEYKEREDFLSQLELATLEQQLQEAFEEYKNNVVDSINNFNSIGSFDLNFEDRDKEELASFMLSQDENGVNYLYLALQDPETLTRAAWFILNGEEAFNSILDYFTNLIKLVSENSYKKGLEDGKGGKNNPTKPTVVIDNSKKNTRRQYNSIEDLDDDE